MKVHYPKLCNMAHLLALYFYCFQRISHLFLLAITAAGAVPCGGPKKSPRTSSIVQIIFSFDPLGSVNIYEVFKFFIC